MTFHLLRDMAVRQGLILFVAARVFLSLWAVVALAASPLPEEPDEQLRPYLGQPRLDASTASLLLGPWQRFDTQHYLRLAGQGYTHVEDSVFPPLYPLAVRAVGALFGGTASASLMVAVLLSNLACLGLLILLHKVVSAELDSATATRTLVYLLLFPTGFFLFAAYTESIFILLALASVWSARRGRFWLAGSLGFFAALTRLTGWVLVVPLLYEWYKNSRVVGSSDSRIVTRHHPSRFTFHVSRLTLPLSTFLPPLALVLFLGWRWWVGLPSLTIVYEQYWFQRTGIPGQDLITAVHTLFLGGMGRANEIASLAFDLVCVLLLLVTTAVAFHRLGPTYSLYSAALLLFMLLPTSDFKPLYSFSRYTLAFFPTFMLLGLAGQRPWVNRLILYPSLVLYLYFSGQFFIWGWVA